MAIESKSKIKRQVDIGSCVRIMTYQLYQKLPLLKIKLTTLQNMIDSFIHMDQLVLI